MVNLKTYETSLSELVARGQVRIAAAGEASEQSGGGGADGDDGGGGGGGGGPDLQLAGRAASRFSLITKPDVVAIATDVAGGRRRTGAGGDGKPAPPPTAKLQCQADEAIGSSTPPPRLPRATRSVLLLRSWAASTAEAKAAHAQGGAGEGGRAARRAVRSAKAMADAQAKCRASHAQSEPADPDRPQPAQGGSGGGGGGGPSEVDTWLDKKLLGSCKGLAGIGVLSLMDLANMDASAIKVR